jgi:4-amino-4-deoxy-L-arabinose transferase-like glycosyltransferase
LIAGTYGIFGRHRLALAAVQAALGTLTAVLVYLLAGSLWGRPTALVAGLLAAAEPLALNYFMFILSETFFALALLAAVAVAGYALRRPRLDWRWGMLAGLLLALSAFVRPVSYFLIFPVAAGFGLVRWMRDRRWTGAAGLVVAVLVPWVLLVGAWRLRNYSVSGYGGFTFQAELNLLFGRRDILVYRDGLDKFEADRRLTDLITKNGFLPPAKLAEVARREGMRLYREHPLLALRGAASGLARTLLGPGALAAYCGSASGGEGAESALGGRPILDLLRLPFRDYLKKWPLGQPIPYAIYLFQVVFLAGVYIGVALAFRALPESLRERWPVHALLLGTVVYCLVVSANCAAYSRFRVPIMPLLCCYAAAGWTWLLSRRRSDAARAAAADSSLPAGCGEPRPASASEGQ